MIFMINKSDSHCANSFSAEIQSEENRRGKLAECGWASSFYSLSGNLFTGRQATRAHEGLPHAARSSVKESRVFSPLRDVGWSQVRLVFCYFLALFVLVCLSAAS